MEYTSGNIKHVVSWQHKRLLEYLKENEFYMCKKTREASYKYKGLQESMGLEEKYPIWVFVPQVTDYIIKGNIFRNECFISLADMSKHLCPELLFHISIGPLDDTKMNRFFENYYLYEFSVPSEVIHKDTLEGYAICGCIPYLWRENIVAVYKPSIDLEKFDETLEIRFEPIFIRDDTSMSTMVFYGPTSNSENYNPNKASKEDIEKEYKRQIGAIEKVVYRVPTRVQIENVKDLL